jgi:hypothetical protein
VYLFIRVTRVDAIKLVSVQKWKPIVGDPENATQDPAVTSVCGAATCCTKAATVFAVAALSVL